MVQAPRTEVLVMIVVLLVTVLVDLITAVGIGVVLASVMFETDGRFGVGKSPRHYRIIPGNTLIKRNNVSWTAA
ncbi:MAG: hypothetical protein R3B83_03740 [Nitrospirales bacterium]|nr:hypothetical protein [Nitrospirales bacterium]